MNLDWTQAAIAAVLGVLEGMTEFLPVSSTGHLLLANHFLGFTSQGNVFEIVIQLGAILAVILLYFHRLWNVAITLPTRAESRRFVLAVLLAFLPAVVIGIFAHDFIKQVLFASPRLIAINLILGGIIILWAERRAHNPVVLEAEAMPLKTALGIGFFQCIAMVPGVSRSGATIIGALLLGVGRKAAAEFSFFLSMPTMIAAASYDLYKNHAALSESDLHLIAIGFAAAFIAALLVVKACVAFISTHGFKPFAWYRIALGTAALIALSLGF
jgi:undecaprenyl-diphosphatase